jgi:hypothetical protein
MSAPEPVHRELGDAPSLAGTEHSPDRIATELKIKIGLLVVFLLAAGAVIRSFLSVLIWSVILAVELFPLLDWTWRRLGGRDWISAALVAVFCLAIVFGPAPAPRSATSRTSGASEGSYVVRSRLATSTARLCLLLSIGGRSD